MLTNHKLPALVPRMTALVPTMTAVSHVHSTTRPLHTLAQLTNMLAKSSVIAEPAPLAGPGGGAVPEGHLEGPQQDRPGRLQPQRGRLLHWLRGRPNPLSATTATCPATSPPTTTRKSTSPRCSRRLSGTPPPSPYSPISALFSCICTRSGTA